MSMENSDLERPTGLGITSLTLGCAALATVLICIVAGPFHPSPDLGVSLGELAGDIGRNAAREFFGLKRPEPEVVEPMGWTIDEKLSVGVIIAGIVTVFLSVVSHLRGERRSIAIIAATLGASALLLQVLQAFLLLILGALILIAFLSSLHNIFSFDFFGG